MFALSAPSALAATVYVDGSVPSSGDGASWATAKKTIQEGIDAAFGAGGGDVWVVQGTYLEAITMKSNVLLYGGFLGTESDLLERNPSSNVTTIDGSTARGGLPAYHVVLMDGISLARLDGFRITGGRADGPGNPDQKGGGIFALNAAASVTVENCTVTGNAAPAAVYPAGGGGGIACEGSFLVIRNCTITANTAGQYEGVGGGMFCANASPLVSNCLFSGNSAGGEGGGLCIYGASAAPRVADCTFLGNTCRIGGAIDVGGYSTPMIERCTFRNNSASAAGGGVFCREFSNSVIRSCLFEQNTSQNNGAAMFFGWDPTVRIEACVFRNNTANDNAAVSCGAADVTIVNSVFAGNRGMNWGGALVCDSNSATNKTVRVTNCTFYGNTTNGGGAAVWSGQFSECAMTNCVVWGNTGSSQVYAASAGNLAASYCDIRDSGGSGALWNPALGADGGGNIDADPLFVDPALNDYHLLAGSPCIDAGDNNPAAGLPATDMEGRPRVAFGAVDMGAYEYYPPVYVDDSVGSSGDGASWATAKKTIQEGIDASAGAGGGEVWVVKGTYPEAITMKSNVLLYGGFLGTETGLPERDHLSNITTIDASTARGGLPAYHVVAMDGTITTGTIRLDGFTITGGVADGSNSSEPYGGGILCASFTATSATIGNCTISGNSAYQSGGGVRCLNASPTITNCWIRGNSAADVNGYFGAGGGVNCYQASPSITNCWISGNSAQFGGGVYCDQSSPTITNCWISENYGPWFTGSASYGGGVSCYQSSPTITNCTISENFAICGGGVSCWYAASPRITNCTISGNSAPVHGGGVHCESGASPTIANCTISENSATVAGGGVSCWINASPTIANCTISGNSTPSGGGIYCYQSSPTITDCRIGGNMAQSAGGGVDCVYYSSPAVTNCTINGNSGAGGLNSQDFSAPIITNCVISGNSGAGGGDMLHGQFLARHLVFRILQQRAKRLSRVRPRLQRPPLLYRRFGNQRPRSRRGEEHFRRSAVRDGRAEGNSRGLDRGGGI